MAKKIANEWPELINNANAFIAKLRELYAKHKLVPAQRAWLDDSRCCPLTLVAAEWLNCEPNKLGFLDIPNLCAKLLQVEREWVDSFTDTWDGYRLKQSVSHAIKLAEYVKQELLPKEEKGNENVEIS